MCSTLVEQKFAELSVCQMHHAVSNLTDAEWENIEYDCCSEIGLPDDEVEGHGWWRQILLSMCPLLLLMALTILCCDARPVQGRVQQCKRSLHACWQMRQMTQTLIGSGRVCRKAVISL